MKLGEIFTGGTLDAEFTRLSTLLEAGIAEMRTAGEEWAVAENQYRKAKAVAFLSLDSDDKKLTVAHKAALVDRACDVEQLRAYMTRANRDTATEYVRSLRTQMSAFQTLTNVRRDEIAMSALPQRR